ncbi:MAG: nucleotide exchange factor GrpE [Methanosarcinales archaeon]|nr:nucleotide exchange factor GrpE [Methanosarcinales archaeon]
MDTMAEEDGELECEEESVGEEADDASARLEKELEEAKCLADERLDQLKRCRAELENVMKMAARDREENIKFASQRLISRLLGFLDSMEQASKHDQGVKLLNLQLLAILEGEGLVPIEAEGKPFDPYRHEALMQVESGELAENTVAQELSRGYILNNRVLRTSKVAVVKKR